MLLENFYVIHRLLSVVQPTKTLTFSMASSSIRFLVKFETESPDKEIRFRHIGQFLQNIKVLSIDEVRSFKFFLLC